MYEHASFFSGVGGLDLGLERAGWRTVSFSEVDPYASAVLAQRWPGVPNLGDIVRLRRLEPEDDGPRIEADGDGPLRPSGSDYRSATLWTGGFPCTDLSVAGKRAGLRNADGSVTRSGLAFAFLDLVGRHRPRAVLLENVPGLLSSHGGKDLGALLGLLGDLGYGWAYRVLDAQWFGVPQRRRRVFILALDLERHPDAFSAAEVLAVGTRCGRDHPQEREAWARTAGRVALGSVGSGNGGPDDNDARSGHLVYNATAKFAEWAGPDDAAGNLSARDYKSSNHLVVDGAPPDPDRVREAPGLAGRLDGGHGLGFAQNQRGEAPVGSGDEPDGLDSHRYRTIGNGVASPVAEWIGRRLMEYLR